MKSIKRFSMSGKPPPASTLSPNGYPNEKEKATSTRASSINEQQENQSAAPPTYSAVDYEQPPPGPPPGASDGPSMDDFVGNFAKLNVAAGLLEFPDTNLAMAHLKLLEAFFQLKGEVGYTDGLFE